MRTAVRPLAPLAFAALVTACAGATRLPSSYAANPHQARYAASLPPAARPPAGDSIRESRRPLAGYDVHVDHLPAITTPARGTVLLLHGGGGNGRLVMTFARPLAKAGWDVLAPDLPGFGLTPPHDGAGVTMETWVRVATAFAREERERSGRPVFLMGLSVGSFVAYNAAAAGAPVDGIVVSMLPDPAEGRVRRAMAGSWWKAHLLAPLGAITSPLTDRWRFPLRRMVPLDVMTPDTAVVAALRDDPLVGARGVRLGLLRSFLSVRLAIDPREFTGPPVLIVHPGADRWTPLELTTPTFHRLCAPKALIVLHGAGHFPLERATWTQLAEGVTGFLADPQARTSRRCASVSPAADRPR